MLCCQSKLSLPDAPLIEEIVGANVRSLFMLSIRSRFRYLQIFCLYATRIQEKDQRVKQLEESVAQIKAAHQLCDTGDVVVMEDLKLMGLSPGFLGKNILDASLGQ